MISWKLRHKSQSMADLKENGLYLFSGGHSTFFALLNSLVHIIMYFYYMVSAMGPKYQKYIWWKKYLTSLQMVRHQKLTMKTFVQTTPTFFLTSLTKTIDRSHKEAHIKPIYPRIKSVYYSNSAFAQNYTTFNLS